MMKPSSFFIALISGAMLLSLSAEPIVSEFVADNESVTVPGASPLLIADWIEIHNPDASSIDLGGWHLTDDPDAPGQWNFPPGTILPSGGYLVVFADGTNQIDAQGFFHTNFSLDRGGEFVVLTRPDESIASSFDPDGSEYPRQRTDVSYGIIQGSTTPVFFNTPTPGGINNTPGEQFADQPEFSVERGIYTDPITLSISTSTPGATIYVTTDSEPPITASGTPTPTASVYTSPITISELTIVRAATTAPSLTPSPIETHSYIFPDSVATQVRPPNYPSSWGTAPNGEPDADYEIDTRISQSTRYATRFRQGLRMLPTLSVAGEVDDIFGSQGIYSRTLERGIEIPISAEYFIPSDTDGENENEGFQIDCGFRIQGGGSRTPSRAIKHSMSLRFRSIYGAGRLNFPIFEEASGGAAVTSFNDLQLRSHFQNSWIHGNAGQRERASYIQDQWVRDSFIAMGNSDGGYGNYVNLYINGLFWGIYNLHERLENHHYADYNGFEPEEITEFNPRERNGPGGIEFRAIRRIIENGTWPEITAVFDVDRYIDSVIVNNFARNVDLRLNSNFRLAGGGSANAIWKIYVWDLERTLENERDVSLPNLPISEDGVDLLDDFDDFPEFRRRFADRVYKHLFNEGALTNMRNRERFIRYVDILDVPIVGESARWGDDRRNNPYTRDNEWQTAIFGTQSVTPRRGVLNGFFPTNGINRTDIIINAWRSRIWRSTPSQTWLPANDPPQFSLPPGSTISSGNPLTLINGSGTILFTIDGTDPAENGITYTGGPIPLTQSGVVRTRTLVNSQFSALNEGAFIVESPASASNFIISEIHYNPDGANSTAFIELQNTSSQPINLLNATFTDGIEYTFTSPLTLAPGEYVVLAEDALAFNARYGFNPTDQYQGELSRNGETIVLSSATGEVIANVRYDDRLPWPTRADDGGSSLERRADTPIYQASARSGGTPGFDPIPPPSILINEVLTNSEPPLTDTIELFNPTNDPVDLSGWFLSDSTQQYMSFRIPDGTTIPSQSHLLFNESDFNNPQSDTIISYSGIVAQAPTTVTISGSLPPENVISITGYGGIGLYSGTHTITRTGANTFTIPKTFIDDAPTKGTWSPGRAFALNADEGETITLSTPGALNFSDSITIGASLPGDSFARYPNIIEGILLPATFQTLGAANSAAPSRGPLLITEIHYDGTPSFIEIHNISSDNQSLTDWTLRGNADFDFPPGSSIASGETAIIAADPSAFSTLPSSIQRFGPWEDGDTLLGTNGGVVRLARPGTPPPDGTSPTPRIAAEEVIFLTESPWPLANGNALQRTSAAIPGSSFAAWNTGTPTPGQFPITQSSFASFVATNNLSGIPTDDPDRDGIPDIGEYALGLDPNSFDPSPLTLNGIDTLPTFTPGPNITDVTIQLEASLDLTNWNVDPATTTASRIFFRLRFTQ